MCRGARDILQRTIETEVKLFLEELGSVSMIDGRRAVVRKGYLQEREILTTVGPVAVQVPKVRDRSGSGEIGAQVLILGHQLDLAAIVPSRCRGAEKQQRGKDEPTDYSFLIHYLDPPTMDPYWEWPFGFSHPRCGRRRYLFRPLAAKGGGGGREGFPVIDPACSFCRTPTVHFCSAGSGYLPAILASRYSAVASRLRSLE